MKLINHMVFYLQ